MKKVYAIALPVFCLLASGCNTAPVETRETVIKQMAQILNRAADVLVTIISPETAAAARPLIERDWEQYQAAMERLEMMPGQQLSQDQSLTLRSAENTLSVTRKLVLSRFQWVELQEPYGPPFVRPFEEFRKLLSIEHRSDVQPYSPGTNLQDPPTEDRRAKPYFFGER